MIERVQQFYDLNADTEWNRLTQGLSAIEFSSTLRLIKKYFPRTGHVADIGSGPGRYSIELARNDYKVSVFDLSDVLLRRAKLEFAKAGLSARTFVQGSATDLSAFADGTFDAALMLGPLIHLTLRAERMQALAELKRVLVPGGVALVQYLNSWGLMRTGLTDFPSWFDFPEKVQALLEEQTFEGTLSGFTDCYWTTPKVALNEVQNAGFDVLSYAGAEAFLGGTAATLEQIRQSSKKRYFNIVEAAATMAELPQFRDSADHLVIVLRKE